MTEKQIIHADGVPAAVGPYSHAVRAGNLVFTAGQIGTRPDTGELAGDDITAQTRQALTNLRQVLAASGSSLEQAVKCTVFLASMDDFQAMNAVYKEFFTESYPARSAFAVAQLPRNARVEIECIALCDDGA